MSDFEDADFFVESWSFLGQKDSKKKDSKKKDQKQKNSSPTKTEPSSRKVKKKSKFKEVMLEKKGEKKGKKKEKRNEKNKDKKKVKKKKKKNKSIVDELMFTQSGSAQAKLLNKLAFINQNEHEDLNPDRLPQDSVKEAKRKKHVAFGLLPSYIRVKRPHFASSSPREAEAVREDESCSQVLLAGQGHQPEDFQYASDDVNSQDLFITQKTFRASPSSSDTSDRVASPRAFEQRDEMKLCQTKADKWTQNSHQSVQELKQKIKTEEEVFELDQWGKMSLQTQMKFKVNFPRQEEESVHVEPKVNPHVDEAFVINPTPEVPSCLQHVSETPPLLPRTTDSSTQTENFFSAELSLYLDFCQKRSVAAHAEVPKPLDLSLPQRARNGLRLSAAVDAEAADQDGMSPRGEAISGGGEGASAPPQVKHDEVKTSLSRLVKTTPSPPSETDTKSTDMTASSEDDHFCRSGKRDLLQVGSVQLRLNKPFFFKTKGDEPSPRAESPLMKLSQGRDTKRKKRR